MSKQIEALAPLAAVSTPTTDAEDEVNGILTSDRRFARIAPGALRILNAPLTQAR